MPLLQNIENDLVTFRKMSGTGKTVAITVVGILAIIGLLTTAPTLVSGVKALGELEAAAASKTIETFQIVIGLVLLGVIVLAILAYLGMMIKAGFEGKSLKEIRIRLAHIEANLEELNKKHGIGPEDT